jgi:hypothetical protein
MTFDERLHRCAAAIRSLGWVVARSAIAAERLTGVLRHLRALNRIRPNRGPGSNRKLALNRIRRTA